ncbi:hypothetical protein BsWGS_23135 [Bradybaena similaris]
MHLCDPLDTIRLPFFKTAGQMICSPLRLALEEITMLRGAGEVHGKAFHVSHRPSTFRRHFLDLWLSFHCGHVTSCILCLQDSPPGLIPPFPSSLSDLNTASMSKVGQDPMLCAMSGHTVSLLQLANITRCNQTIVQHSTYRLARIRPDMVLFPPWGLCFIVNRLQPNAEREFVKCKDPGLFSNNEK